MNLTATDTTTPELSTPVRARKLKSDKMLWVLSIIFLLLLVANTIFSKPVLAIALAIYLPFVVTHLFACFRQSYTLLTKPLSFPALWLLFIASYTWSVVPRTSMERILTLTAFLLLALFVTMRHLESGFIKSLRTASLWLICSIILYCIFYLKGAALTGRFVAFYHQKNNLGVMMAFCALVLMYAPGRKIIHIGFGLIAMVFLLASRSKTSIALILICSLLLLLAEWWAKKNATAAPTGKIRKISLGPMLYPMALISLFALVVFRDQFLDFLWTHFTKEMLTERGTLWLTVIQHIRGNSLLGIGPGTFWDANGASEIAHTVLYLSDAQWIQNMVSADGSYIDLMASVGVLGLALFLLTAVDLYRLLFRNWQQPDSRMLFLMITFVLLHAITETTILASTNILWFVYLLCYFRVVYFEKLRTGKWPNLIKKKV